MPTDTSADPFFAFSYRDNSGLERNFRYERLKPTRPGPQLRLNEEGLEFFGKDARTPVFEIKFQGGRAFVKKAETPG